MKIRASVLTPVLALLTVAALIGTGIVLGQTNRGEADATLLGPTPGLTAAPTDSTVVAHAPDTAPSADADAPNSGQEGVTVESVPPTPVVTTGGPGVGADTPAPAPRPSTGGLGTTAPPVDEIDQPSPERDEADEPDEREVEARAADDHEPESHEIEDD